MRGQQSAKSDAQKDTNKIKKTNFTQQVPARPKGQTKVMDLNEKTHAAQPVDRSITFDIGHT